jgi:fatty acid synthase subunit alpha
VAEASPESTAEATLVAIAAPPAAVAPIAAPAPSSSGPAATIADDPLKAVDTLRAIFAQKLKKTIGEIPMGKSIKDLVQGKSTLQNEILGDLQLEFACTPPFRPVTTAHSASIQADWSRDSSEERCLEYATSVKAHRSKAWGLGPSRSDGVLLLATTMEPPKRLGSAPKQRRGWIPLFLVTLNRLVSHFLLVVLGEVVAEEEEAEEAQ